MVGRILSVIIVAAYVTLACFGVGGVWALRASFPCLLGLFCIWVPDAMGAWTGERFFRPSITDESPGCLVYYLGWVLLLVPVIAVLIVEFLA